jgi:hypothetical protein
MDDDLFEAIETRRTAERADGTTEVRPRSDVACELLRLGLIVAEEFDKAPFDVDRENRPHALRQAMIDWRKREERRD